MKNLILLVIATCIISTGCYVTIEDKQKQYRERQQESITQHAPPGATNVIAINHEWIEFTYKEHRFLMRPALSYRGHSVLARID